MRDVLLTQAEAQPVHQLLTDIGVLHVVEQRLAVELDDAGDAGLVAARLEGVTVLRGLGLHLVDQRRRDWVAVIGQTRRMAVENEPGVEVSDGSGGLIEMQPRDHLRRARVAAAIHRLERLAVRQLIAKPVRGDRADLTKNAARQPSETAERIGHGQPTPGQENDFGLAVADDAQAVWLGIVRARAGDEIARDGAPWALVGRQGPVSPKGDGLQYWREILTNRRGNCGEFEDSPQLPGLQPGGASSKCSNSKPGATVQPTRVQSPRDLDVCQASAGTMPCGRWPASKSVPRMVTCARPLPATVSSSGAPAYQ